MYNAGSKKIDFEVFAWKGNHGHIFRQICVCVHGKHKNTNNTFVANLKIDWITESEKKFMKDTVVCRKSFEKQSRLISTITHFSTSTTEHSENAHKMGNFEDGGLWGRWGLLNPILNKTCEPELWKCARKQGRQCRACERLHCFTWPHPRPEPSWPYLTNF